MHYRRVSAIRKGSMLVQQKHTIKQADYQQPCALTSSFYVQKQRLKQIIFYYYFYNSIIQVIKHKTDKYSKRHGLHGFTDLL